MGQKQHETACPKLEEAQRLLPDALGIKEQLALCYEGAGRLASAWSAWRILEDLAGKANQATRLKLAQEHAAALRPRLATLAVVVPEGSANLDGLVVKRDGIELGRALWGTSVPVDKGAHEVMAVASGMTAFQKKVDVTADGDKVSVTIQFVRTAPTVSVAPSAPPAPEKPRAWQKPVGFAGIGVGAAGLIAGGIFGGLAIAKKGESNNGLCDEQSFCNQEGFDLRAQARSFGDISTIAIIAGGVLALGGLTLVILSPSESEAKPAEPRLSLRVAPRGLTFDGEF